MLVLRLVNILQKSLKKFKKHFKINKNHFLKQNRLNKLQRLEANFLQVNKI